MVGKFVVCCAAFLVACLAVCHADTNSTTDRCAKYECTQPCPHGNVLDSEGCSMCECKPDPRNIKLTSDPFQDCPVCTKHCQYGRKLAPNGCLSCQCRTEPTHFKMAPVYGRPLVRPATFQQRSQCPPLLCKNYCDFGRVKDSDGCDTCRCNVESSDSSGPAPVGRQLGCPPSRCKNFCFFGRMQDSNGCEICRCRANTGPSDTSASSAVGRQLGCPPSRCKNFCFFGRMQDSNGCEICRCRASTDAIGRGGFNQFRNIQQPIQIRCPQLRCPNFCRSRYWSVDSRGCPTCECQEFSPF